MTSTSQPTDKTAPNSAASSTPSYASAAGTTKKSSTPGPLVVTGANPPSAAGSAAQPASATNQNGRPSVSPAVPTVANGASSLNGDAANHTRNGSVTIAAPGNGYNNKAAASGLQFGFEKTPQPTPAAPVAIPGAARVPSPSHSPSPIPQSSVSGGKPGSTDNAFKIGSFNNDGDRMAAMRPTSMQMAPSFHSRRDSSVSQHSDMGHHGGPGPGRGGFPPQGGRGGRGGYNPQYNGGPMPGYPPNNNFPRGPQGRGMPNQGYGRNSMQYPNSPNPPRGSPAMAHAMPGQGTPNMGNAIPVPPSQYGGHQHAYPPPMSGGYTPQVKAHSSQDSFIPFNQKAHKKKGARWDHENKPSQSLQLDSSWQHPNQDFGGGRPRRLSKRRDSVADYDRPRGRGPVLNHQAPPYHFQAPMSDAVVDLTPGSDGFARFEQILTATKQNNYQYGGYDPNRPPYMGMPQYPNQQANFPMGYHPPGSPAPGGYPFAAGGQFAPPQGQPMSRNNSQLSEQRPASSTGNQGTIPPQAQKPAIASTATNSQFVRPKSTAIKITNAAGEKIDISQLKQPASPAPSGNAPPSKTPPVIASTPTPPPKASTPASHVRNESTPVTKPDDVKAKFMEQVKNAVTKTDDKVAESPKQEEKQDKQEQPEDKAAEATPEVEPEVKPKAEAEAQPKAEAEELVKDEGEPKVEEKQSDASAKADEKPAETEDEYMERMIREMEEEDARREAEQAEITKRKTAEKEAAKKKADEERLASSAENDRKLREQEREMERLEEEKEKRREAENAREQGVAAGEDKKSTSELLAGKISDLTGSQNKDTSSVADKLGKLTISSTRDAAALSPGSAPSSAKSTGKDRRPAALNLAPLKTGSVEAPPPSAAMQALKSARFLTIRDEIKYPVGISSPNPATNAAAAKKGGSFKYDSAFLLQFQKAFTEQPSVEFSQQVKALIGDSDGARSASTRGSGQGPRTGSKGGASGGAFGSFTQPASGKPLPQGTTSEQRFAMAQGQMPRPMSGAMAFGRGGGFPGASPMTRTASGLGLNSRSGSRTQTRGGSKQGQSNPQTDAKLARTMPLTAGMELKPIAISSTGWKPQSLARNAAAQNTNEDYIAPDVVQRKVKAALNKMTPENFDKIAQQILDIAAQSKDESDGRTLRQVIQLTFEKATDEAHWAGMYARFCKKMLENMSPEIKDTTITDKNGNVVSGGALFRKYLLNRCQEDFERGWNVDMPEPKEGESKEAALMSDEYYKAQALKRRGLGLVQFIGELFKLGMLTERIMHECVRKLLDFKSEPDEAEIESLSKLLRTIGSNLDATEKGHAFMNAYFERISTLVDAPDLPSRLKFMLMDIVDLRKHNWQSKDGGLLKGPKTLEEIRLEAEAAAAAKAAEASRSTARHTGGNRQQMGRGDARNSYGSFHPPASNTVGMDDLRRLKATSSRTASGPISLGPTSMFNSRSNSGRRLGPGGSLSRGGEGFDSGASSRTGTPPTQNTSTNAFAALANMPGESENPASPPSQAASPALKHAKPATSDNSAK